MLAPQRQRLLWAFVFGLAVVAAPRSTRAQGITGTILGTVKDAQGGVIPGATVTIISETQKTVSAPVVTNEAGESIGNVSDLLFDKSGRIVTVVIGVGGFLGIGEKSVAVPFASLTVAADANNPIGAAFRSSACQVVAGSGSATSAIVAPLIRSADAAADLPHRRQRVLGHPDDALGRRAGAGRQEPHATPRPQDLRPLLLGLEPAHGRAARERGHLLGCQHAAELPLERDDARDRSRSAPDGPIGSRE